MENESTKKNFLIDTLKGLPLGVSAAVPGVSAGTIAIIEKCYDRIINSIADLKKSFKANFLSLLPFLLGYLIGGALALLAIEKGYVLAASLAKGSVTAIGGTTARIIFEIVDF